MPDGSGTLLARTLVGRDAELAALQDAWRAGRRGAGRVGAGRGRQEPARARAGVVGADERRRSCSPDAAAPPGRTRRCGRGARRSSRRPAPGGRPAADLDAVRAGARAGGAGVGRGRRRRLGPRARRGGAAAAVVVGHAEHDHPARGRGPALGRPRVARRARVRRRQPGRRPVLVVATLRDGEPGPGPTSPPTSSPGAPPSRVRLEPLTDDEVLAVARSCLDGGDLPDDAGAALVARSEGVPFLVEELLATAVRSGWDTITDDVPGSVTASVATRLADLPPAARPLLTAAALLGRHFDWTARRGRGRRRRRRGRRAPAAGGAGAARRRRGRRLPVPPRPHP